MFIGVLSKRSIHFDMSGCKMQTIIHILTFIYMKATLSVTKAKIELHMKHGQLVYDSH